MITEQHRIRQARYIAKPGKMEMHLAACKRWRDSHKQHNLEINRAWRKKNSERLRSKARERYARNKTRMAIKRKLYLLKNPSIARKAASNYRKNHPEAHKRTRSVLSIKYWARKRNATVNDPKINALIRSWKMDSDFVCAFCANTFPISLLHVDHILPIVKGGQHTVSNICKSCRRCNQSKGGKFLKDWIAGKQQVFAL